MRSRTVVLREEHKTGDFRGLTARVTEEGNLSIEGQDLGSGVEGSWGSGLTEYEWTITVRASEIPRVVAALNGKEGDDVLELLSARCSENEWYASRTFFEQHGIPTEFWSRVGD
jgi:hypothetical protein